MHRLTLNGLISLIIQAKITGKGKTGNGRVLIRLLSVIADCPADSQKERNLLSIFSNHADKQAAYQQINRFLVDFIRNGNGFPADKITVHQFENQVSLHSKTNWKYYRSYLAETGKFCEEILDKTKISAFIGTLLNLLKEDDSIQSVFYGWQFLAKNSLISDTPKKICLEALLLGLLYHTLKKFTPANAGDIQMHDFEYGNFQVIQLGTAENPVFWGDCEELKILLQPEISVSVEENLKVNSVLKNDFCYPIEIKYQNKIILYHDFFDKIKQKYLFLHSSGGFGKSFLLQHQNGLFLSLSNYQPEIRKQILPQISSWILIQILLKYHYHYAYPTYELCSACEEETAVFRHISEILHLFEKKNSLSEYTFLLDGVNEMNPEFQDDFAEEIRYISENWHNVRIIISSRTVPNQKIFDKFEKLEILGIPDDTRDKLLSDYPENIKNHDLLEILKAPIFMKYFLENQGTHEILHTRGEILNTYFENHIKNYEKPLQFVIKYALPFLAWHKSSDFKRSDIAKAIHQATELFLNQEDAYQDFLSMHSFRKYPILKALETADFVGILIEKLGIFAVIDNHLQFSHDYLWNYFSAKYILNASYAVVQTESQKLFQELGLNDIWWTYQDMPYILIGEICGDYRNIPDKNGNLSYQRTELDMLLDMARTFNTNMLTFSVMKTMDFARNHLICGVNFSGLMLPPFIPANAKFNNNGDYPSNFHRCRIDFPSDKPSDIFCADFSYDNKKLLLGMEDSHVILFDFKAGRVLKNYNLHAYLKYLECFQTIKFLNHDKQFAIATEHIEFLIETATGQIITIQSQKKYFSHHRQATAISPNHQYFFIGDMLYSVTGERKKIQFSERHNHFKNCDAIKFTSLFNYEKNKEILRKSRALTE